MEELYLIYFCFILGFIMELIYLQSMNKLHFLLAVSLICVGSFITFLNYANYKVVPLFFFAIIASLIGDMFMADKISFTGERIIDGILGFTVAHISYTYAFYSLTLDNYQVWYVIGSTIVFLSFFFFVIFNPQLKSTIKYGSIFYTLLMITLFVTVLRFVFTDHVPVSAIITSLVGIILFIISDSILAYNEFKQEIKHAEIYISITYISAQILLQLTPILLL